VKILAQDPLYQDDSGKNLRGHRRYLEAHHTPPWPGEALIASLHELFGPGVEGSWSDALPPTEVTDGYLPPESLQDDADLLFWGVLLAGCCSNLSHEGPGLLSASLSSLGLVYVALGDVGSFLDADTLYPASGALSIFLLSGFIPSKCVPLSLTFYTPDPIMIVGKVL
jgi:hypothetical protein